MAFRIQNESKAHLTEANWKISLDFFPSLLYLIKTNLLQHLVDITGVYWNAYSFIWHQGTKDDSFFLWGCIFLGYVCYLVSCRKSTALRSGAVEAEGENADFNSHSYIATYHDLSNFSYSLWCDISVILTGEPLMSAFSLPVYWLLELRKCNQYCEVHAEPS